MWKPKVFRYNSLIELIQNLMKSFIIKSCNYWIKETDFSKFNKLQSTSYKKI